LSSAVGISDGSRGGLGVPVGTAWNDVLAANGGAGEPKVVRGERTIGRFEITVVAGDAAIVANTAARVVQQVAAEGPHAGVELLEDDGLGLDFANLLSDDPLGHLLDDEKTLLDNFDGLAVANDF